MPGTVRHRPSWIVIGPKADLRRHGVAHVREKDGIVAAYEPEPGAQFSREHELAAALSAEHPGRYYALTLATVADDPDHGIDEAVAYEDGVAIGKPKARPVLLVKHFGLDVPGLEPIAGKLAAADLALTPMAPKPRRGERKYLGFTLAQWEHTFATQRLSDISYLVDGATRASYAPLIPLLDSAHREIAVRLLYFADADPEWVAKLEALRKKADPRLRSALDATLKNWRR
jgi:hypothetical protein